MYVQMYVKINTKDCLKNYMSMTQDFILVNLDRPSPPTHNYYVTVQKTLEV